MTNDEQREADLEILKRHCQGLGEHFETVQIFVSRHMPAELDGTRSMNYGSGNWFARYGQVSLWMTQSKEREREHIRREE